MLNLRTNGECTCIIGTDHQHNISVGEVLVDFIHLEHDCGLASDCGLSSLPQQLTIVGHAGLCQQYVKLHESLVILLEMIHGATYLSWHSSGDYPRW